MKSPACPMLRTRLVQRGWHGRYHRGHRRCVRAAKRHEAHLRIRAARRRPPRPVAPCQWPWKKAYENRDSVMATFDALPKFRKGMGLNPYECPAGHWHLGRKITRARVAWRPVA